MNKSGKENPVLNSLKKSAAVLLILYVVEMMAMLFRFTPMPSDLPWRVLAVHTVLLIPLFLFIFFMSRICRRMGLSAGTAGWMAFYGTIIAGAGIGSFYSFVFAGGVIIVLIFAVFLDRLISKKSPFGPIGFILSITLACVLAKGSLLENFGWTNVGIALLWMIIASGFLVMFQTVGHKNRRIIWLIILIMGLLLPVSIQFLPKPEISPMLGKSEAEKVNIVVIVLDTMRGDFFKGRFSGTDLMPRFTAYTEKHCISTILHAPAPSSLSTHATLFTGQPAYAHGAHKPWNHDPDPPSYAYALGEEAVTIAERLARAGYATAAISGNYAPLSPVFGLNQGFQHYDATRNEANRFVKKLLIQRFIPFQRFVERLPFSVYGYASTTPYRNAEQIIDGAVDLLVSMKGKQFFLFVNIFDMHIPYIPPDYWKLRREMPGSGWIHDGQPTEDVHGSVMRMRKILTPEETAFLDAIYTHQAIYLDRYLDRLLNVINRENTLLVMLSDHGESLGEHSLLRHSSTLLKEQIEVPCYIGYPQNENQRFLSTRPPVRDVPDLHDLILAAANVDVPERPEPPGVIAEVYTAYHPRAYKPDRPIFKGELRALIQEPFKFLWASDGKHQLFNMKTDPGERRNLADKYPERMEEMTIQLESYLALFSGAGTQPAKDPPLNKMDMEALKTLGYIQ